MRSIVHITERFDCEAIRIADIGIFVSKVTSLPPFFAASASKYRSVSCFEPSTLSDAKMEPSSREISSGQKWWSLFAINALNCSIESDTEYVMTVL